MKLEGIHHITAITADGQKNVDFYVGVLGLRLVKKTVNQDQTSVYHLFYADEEGDPGSDLTFFEFPGTPPGRAGAGMVHRVVWRVALARGDRLLGAPPAASAASRRGARTASLIFTDPEGLDHELLVPDVPDRAADGRASRDPGRARAAGLSRRARLRRRSRAQPRALRAGARVRARRRRALGGARARPRRPLHRRRAAARARAPGRGQRPPHRLGVAHRRPRGLARARDRRRRPPDAGHRPLLLPLDLLPRAERGAVRARDDRGPGLRDRRGPEHLGEKLSLPPFIEHLRAEIEPALTPIRNPRDSARRLSLDHLVREPAGEPEGALILNHGRGTSEHDLFPLLDLLDPERRLRRRLSRGAADRDPARRAPLVRRRARRLPGPRDVRGRATRR